jgi:hypothetical protein
MRRSGTGLFTDLGPARWVKIRTPDGGPHWVSQPASHVSSEQTKHSHEVTGAGAGHGHPEDKVEALPADLAIGDVFCIVLHALGNGDPIVRARMTSFYFFRAVHIRLFHVRFLTSGSLPSHPETLGVTAHL